MDLFSEQLVRSERAAWELEVNKAEVVGRYAAIARQVRPRAWLRPRGWKLLVIRRRKPATTQTLTIRGPATTTPP